MGRVSKHEGAAHRFHYKNHGFGGGVTLIAILA